MSKARWLSPEEVAAAKRMREEGLVWREIGKRLNRDPVGLCRATGFMKTASGQMRHYVPRGTRKPVPKHMLFESPLGPNGGLLINNPQA